MHIQVESCTSTAAASCGGVASSLGPSLCGRRARTHQLAHVPICNQNLVTSYIPVSKILSKKLLFTITTLSQIHSSLANKHMRQAQRVNLFEQLTGKGHTKHYPGACLN